MYKTTDLRTFPSAYRVPSAILEPVDDISFTNQSSSLNTLAKPSVPSNYAIQACIDYPNVSRPLSQRLNWWNCPFILSDLSETWKKGKLVLHVETARSACWVSISTVLQKFYFRINLHLTVSSINDTYVLWTQLCDGINCGNVGGGGGSMAAFLTELQNRVSHISFSVILNIAVLANAMPWFRRLVDGHLLTGSGFDPRLVHVRLVVDIVALGQVLSQVLRFSPVIIILSIPHTHSTITDAV
jgi:hypothetical protein